MAVSIIESEQMQPHGLLRSAPKCCRSLEFMEMNLCFFASIVGEPLKDCWGTQIETGLLRIFFGLEMMGTDWDGSPRDEG